MMQRVLVIALMLGVVILRQSNAGEGAKTDETKDAKLVVEAFRDRLKEGKIDDAFALISEVPKARDQFATRMKSKLERFATAYGGGERGLEVVDARVDGDCAVVAALETKANAANSKDYDPVYLVNRDGKWRILPGINEYDLTKNGLDVGLDETALMRFADLSSWFKEFKTKARKR